MIRKAVVSGTFYPANPKQLEKFIEESTPEDIKPKEAKAIMLPHAGLIYSGRVAVETVARIKPKSLAIIMGPNHTGRGLPFSVYPQGQWQTPLGNIAIESEIVKDLIKKDILKEDAQAHIYEHSIEVELPILKYFFKEFKFIPIVCTLARITIYRQIAKIIYEVLQEKQILKDSLIVASSDMTHYEPHSQAIEKDKYVIEAILNLDTEEFLKRVGEKDVSMCGVAPVGIMLEILKLTGAANSYLVNYSTSGQINKDYSSVVGYVGLIFN